MWKNRIDKFSKILKENMCRDYFNMLKFIFTNYSVGAL